MDFTFTEDQLAFREAISRFLMTEAPPEMLREIWDTDDGRSPELRGKMAEQGLTALSVPEAQGGLGMDDIAWSLLTQELGYYAIADSLADTAYVATGHPASHRRVQKLRRRLLRLPRPMEQAESHRIAGIERLLPLHHRSFVAPIRANCCF